MKTPNKLFLLLLALSPGFWWLLFQPGRVASEWSAAPANAVAKAQFLANPPMEKIFAMRRAQDQSGAGLDTLSKVLYNRFTAYAQEFFSFSAGFSPRYYFQSGDGGPLSPPGVEPVPILLFPLWLYGLAQAFYAKNVRLYVGVLLAGLAAFVFGGSSMAFRLPLLVLYVYCATLGVFALPKRWYKVLLLLLVPYSLFLITRSLWL